jgi:tripartite-type tricarboxylate transporter receptor subunit TctC
MQKMNKKLTIGLVVLIGSVLSGVATAQSYPDRPVKIVVPYSAGGTADFSARQIAQKLTEQTKQSFFVENKVGASGTIATNFVAKAAPDGYTLLANDTTYAMLPSLFKNLPWDHANDLEPIAIITQTPVVLVVPESSPFKTLTSLIAYAKVNPGKLNYGSGGTGSSTHLSAEIFEEVAQIKSSHVPYKGAGEAMLAVLSGQVDYVITAAPTAIPQLQGGKIRALAITGPKRLTAISNVPTFKEAGLPAYVVSNWFGLAAPKGTPTAIINKLSAEVKKGLADPELKERLTKLGAEPGGVSPAEFKKFIQNETIAWGAAAKQAGLTAE